MKTNIEKEYKLLVTKEQFEQLVSLYEPIFFHKQVNTYYDTTDHRIADLHGAMRIREIDGHFIFTLKLWKNQQLYEYECEVKNNSIEALQNEQIVMLLKEHGIYGEMTVLTSLTTYRGEVISNDAILCFDHSLYNGIEDFEIEYEYRREHDGRRAFQTILVPLHIQYEKNCISKIQRALQSLSQ